LEVRCYNCRAFSPDDLARAAATLDAEARIVSSPPDRAVFGALRIYERATGERLRRWGTRLGANSNNRNSRKVIR
jgi:hypothetical protein